MTIIARRFTIICLVMGIFAVSLAMIVQHSERRNTTFGAIGLSAPCPQPTGLYCRTAL